MVGRSDGTVAAFGLNNAGQLGNNTTVDSKVAMPVPGLTDTVQVAAGYAHSVALKGDGTVWTWGYNANGQLGNNTTTQSNVPVQVTGLTGVVSISSSYNHNLAVKGDGTLWAWGWGANGQLGNNSTLNRLVPTQVAGLANIVGASAGYAHSLALRTDGGVFAFGLNNTGQMGDNTLVDRHNPTQVANIVSATAVEAGTGHSVALRGDGAVWAWGHNAYGQLGDGTTTNRLIAQIVPNLGGINAVSVHGGYSTMSRGADNVLRSWGINSSGQLGINSTTQSNAPVAVSGQGSVTEFNVGITHSMSTKTDGALFSWGSNAYGQLGNNTLVNALIPVTPNGPGLAAQSVTLAAAGGARAVTVTWAAPAATGGRPITGYTLKLYQGNPGSGTLISTQTCAGPCASYTFANLTDNATYHVTVAAVTGAGTGPVATSNPTGTSGDLSGAGDRSFFSFVSTTLNDRITAKVNVGTGNLLVTSPDLSVPTVGGIRTVGRAYNSLALAPGAVSSASPVFGHGWRLSDAPDLRLIVNNNSPQSVTFVSGSGNSATFTGAGLTAPPGLDATLVANPDLTWTMTFLASAQKLTFDAGGLLLSDTDRNNNTITFAYPNPGKPTPVQGNAGIAPGNTVNLVYGGPGGKLSQMNQTSDGVTRTVAYGYDPAGDLTQVTDAAGKVTTMGYDALHRLVRITGPGPLFAVTRFGYDAGHRVTTLTRVLGVGVEATTRFDYTVAKHTKIIDPLGNPPTDLTIDASGRVTATLDAKGQDTSRTFTADAKVDSSTNGYGAAMGKTINVYGANGGDSMTRSTGPTGAQGNASYATSGLPYLPDTTTNPMGRVSTYGYDGPGNQTSNTDSNNNVANVAYNTTAPNTDGTVKSSTDAGNGIISTGYGYNAVHQLTSVTPPTGTLGARTFTYDGAGRTKTVTDGNGVTITYSYDKLDRPTGQTHSDATPAIGYSYDANGNIAQRTDQTGTTTYGYDRANRLLTKAIPFGSTLAYGYDLAGNLTSLSGDGRGTTTYRYDKVNQVDQATLSSGRTVVFAYDADGRRTDTWSATNGGVVYDASGNNVVAPTGFAAHTKGIFDGAGHLTRLTTTRASSDTDPTRVVSDLEYDYTVRTVTACADATAETATDLRHTSKDKISGVVTVYCYDKPGRLLSATTPGGATYTYGYDANGNRTSDAAGTHSFNTANQITASVVDPGVAHDPNGNLTASNTLGALGYNGIDQNISVTPVGEAAKTLGYAGATQDEQVRAGATTLVNGATGVQAETTAGTSTFYEKDPSGTLLATRTGTAEFFYYFDGTGSVLGLIDPAGTQRAAYTYDPYGANHTATGINGALPANPWRYAGGYLDGTTGLYHYGARHYQPTLGRWTQQDSLNAIGDPANGNRYAYVGGDPINNIDPSGREFLGIDCPLGETDDGGCNGAEEAKDVAPDVAGAAAGAATFALTRSTETALAVAACTKYGTKEAIRGGDLGQVGTACAVAGEIAYQVATLGRG